MTYTSVEIIALVVILASAIKMVMLLVNPKAWINFAKSLYKKPNFAKVVAFILAAVVLYYLLDAGITIIQILAVTAFLALLLIFGLANEIPYILKRYETAVKKGKMWKDHWFYALVWIALLIWGIKELFF